MKQLILDRMHFDDLLEALRRDGYTVIAPTVADGAIVYGEVERAEQLPAGWTDQQEAGRYRLQRRDDGRLFGYNVGPQSWKKYLHVPLLTMWRAQCNGHSFSIDAAVADPPRLAFLGVRSCELTAIGIQDRVLSGSDPHYVSRRRNALIVAVNCSQAGNTCFCASMNSGPQVSNGFDLALTELLDEAGHRFLVAVGSEAGASVMQGVRHQPAADADRAAAAEQGAKTTAAMGRTMQADGLRDLLFRNLEHERWDQVADRCLACTNCTMACPTCFCTAVEDVTSLSDAASAERVRRWDSCFNSAFSYLHGGSVRNSRKSRYRQWLTHKLASWHDQFGSSGCVGCGRCITWCPVGIDITEEVAAIRRTESERRDP